MSWAGPVLASPTISARSASGSAMQHNTATHHAPSIGRSASHTPSANAKHEQHATRNKQQATRNKRQATSNNQQATGTTHQASSTKHRGTTHRDTRSSWEDWGGWRPGGRGSPWARDPRLRTETGESPFRAFTAGTVHGSRWAVLCSPFSCHRCGVAGSSYTGGGSTLCCYGGGAGPHLRVTRWGVVR